MIHTKLERICSTEQGHRYPTAHSIRRFGGYRLNFPPPIGTSANPVDKASREYVYTGFPEVA